MRPDGRWPSVSGSWTASPAKLLGAFDLEALISPFRNYHPVPLRWTLFGSDASPGACRNFQLKVTIVHRSVPHAPRAVFMIEPSFGDYFLPAIVRMAELNPEQSDPAVDAWFPRSEEHTSELQSLRH